MRNKTYRSNIMPVLFILCVVPYISMCLVSSIIGGSIFIFPKTTSIVIVNTSIYDFLPIINLLLIVTFSIIYIMHVENIICFFNNIKSKVLKFVSVIYFLIVILSYLFSVFFNSLLAGFMIAYLKRENPLIRDIAFGLEDIYAIVLIIGVVLYILVSLIVIYKSIKYCRKKEKIEVLEQKNKNKKM